MILNKFKNKSIRIYNRKKLIIKNQLIIMFIKINLENKETNKNQIHMLMIFIVIKIHKGIIYLKMLNFNKIIKIAIMLNNRMIFNKIIFNKINNKAYNRINYKRLKMICLMIVQIKIPLDYKIKEILIIILIKIIMG